MPARTVVIVEDSRQIFELLSELLSTTGLFHVVGPFDDETSATAWLQEHDARWRFAIVDLVLKNGSGFHLVQRFRRANPDGKIVVLSDYATPAIKIRCVELGADAVFTKGEVTSFIQYVQRTQKVAEAG